MSEIKCYYGQASGACLSLDNFIPTLQEYLNKVLSAIGESDAGITWYICEEKNLPDYPRDPLTKLLNEAFSSMWNLQCGRSYIPTKEIWISTAAIMTGTSRKMGSPVLNSVMPKRREPELLVDVILDELAHIKTGLDHGNPVYDGVLRDYRDRYYDNWFPLKPI